MNSTKRSRPQPTRRSDWLLASVMAVALMGLNVSGCTRTKTAGQENAKTAPKGDAKKEAQKAAAMLQVDVVASKLPAKAPIKPLWALSFGKQRITHIWLPRPWIDSPLMIVQTNANELAAITRADGEMKWRKKLPGPLHGDPAISAHGVYFIVKSIMYGLNIHDGRVIWQDELKFPPSGGVHVSEATKNKPFFFVPSLDQRVYALELTQEIWPPDHGLQKLSKKEIVVRHTWLRENWRYPASAQIVDAIDYYNQFIYIADFSRTVHGVSTAQFSLGKPSRIRRYRTQGAIIAAPKVIGPYLLIASDDRSLYCLSRRELGFVWKYPSGFVLEKTPQVVNDRNTSHITFALKCGKKGPLVGLYAHTGVNKEGKPRWILPSGKSVVALFTNRENLRARRGIMVVHNKDGTLSGHYSENGEEIWKIPAKDFNYFLPNGREALIYATLNEGSVLTALRKRK